MRVLVVLLAGQAMGTMDQSILAVAAPSLRTELHASDAQLQLVVAMYTLAFAALVVIGARLGDVVGRRRAFVTGLAAFTVASLAGGLAPTPAFLIVARAAQGAAAALMTPQVLSIIQLQFAGERRARAIGAYSLILAVGVAAGQVIGGLLVGAELLDDAWRPALLLNAPVGVAVLLVARRGLPAVQPGPERRPDPPRSPGPALALLGPLPPATFGRGPGAAARPRRFRGPGAGAAGPRPPDHFRSRRGVAGMGVAVAGRLCAGAMGLRGARAPGAGGRARSALRSRRASPSGCRRRRRRRVTGDGLLRRLPARADPAPAAGAPLHAAACGPDLRRLRRRLRRREPDLDARRRGRARLPVAGPLVMGAALLGVGL